MNFQNMLLRNQSNPIVRNLRGGVGRIIGRSCTKPGQAYYNTLYDTGNVDDGPEFWEIKSGKSPGALNGGFLVSRAWIEVCRSISSLLDFGAKVRMADLNPSECLLTIKFVRILASRDANLPQVMSEDWFQYILNQVINSLTFFTSSEIILFISDLSALKVPNLSSLAAPLQECIPKFWANDVILVAKFCHQLDLTDEGLYTAIATRMTFLWKYFKREDFVTIFMVFSHRPCPRPFTALLIECIEDKLKIHDTVVLFYCFQLLQRISCDHAEGKSLKNLVPHLAAEISSRHANDPQKFTENILTAVVILAHTYSCITYFVTTVQDAPLLHTFSFSLLLHYLARPPGSSGSRIALTRAPSLPDSFARCLSFAPLQPLSTAEILRVLAAAKEAQARRDYSMYDRTCKHFTTH
jgi:hypothetical protein